MSPTIPSTENLFGMLSMISGLANQVEQKAKAEQQREIAKKEQSRPEDALGLIGAFAPIIIGEFAKKSGENGLLEKVSQLGQAVRNSNCNIGEQNVTNHIEQTISPKEDVDWEQRRFELVKTILANSSYVDGSTQDVSIQAAFEMADKVIERMK